MKFHEYANLFPMMAEMDLMRLAEDIKEKGQSDPVITLDGLILDGRNRFKACEFNGITPRCEEYAGDDPLGFVISHNLHRRHLTEPQRSMIAGAIANLNRGQRSDSGIPLSAITQPDAAKMMNVSLDSVKQARKVAKQGVPELIAAVKDGGVSLAAAADVSTLSKEDQSEVVSRGKVAIREAAKAIRQTKDDPEPDAEPVIVDGVTESPKPTRTAKWAPDDAARLWLLAKIDLSKILPTDRSRERVLREIIAYAQNRIETNK